MKLLRVSLYQKALLALMAPFVIQIVLFLCYGGMLVQAKRIEEAQAKSRAVMACANWFYGEICAGILGQQGKETTSNSGYDTLFRYSANSLTHTALELRRLVGDNPEQSKRVSRMQALASSLVQMLALDDQTKSRNLLADPQIQSTITEIGQLRHDLLKEERRQINSESLVLPAECDKITGAISVFVALDVLAAVVVVSLFSKNVAARLSVVSENLLRLARRKPLTDHLSGEDEVAQLDQLMHHVDGILTDLLHKEAAIAENAVDVICSISAEGRFLQINKACETAWGYMREELLGMRVAKILHPDSRSSFSDELDKPSSSDIHKFDVKLICHDGAVLDLAWSCSWSSSDNAFFCVAHDVSERKRLERLKQDFLAVIGHDMRSPLTSIILFLDCLKAGIYGHVSDKIELRSERCSSTAKQLVQLINDLLDLEKLEYGAMEVSFENIRTDSMINDLLDSLRQLAEIRHIEIRTDLSNEMLEADKDRMWQVFLNLISNAIKFSPDGGTVTVSSLARDGFIEFSVSDQGRGVPERFQQLIFERFKQTESRDSRSGTGLGLAICKSIVQAHHGAIGVESEEGKGSRFWVRLPQRQSDAPMQTVSAPDSIPESIRELVPESIPKSKSDLEEAAICAEKTTGSTQI